MNKLSHYDGAGSPRMVDVSGKPETRRVARAQAFVRIRPEALAELRRNPKGNPLEIARIAGIAAAKRTSELIPLCHPLMLTHADVEASVEEGGVRIVASAATTAQTGVEMEALTAASVAALTVYDMLKALDKSIEIQDVYLLEKTGGKSGDFRREGAGIHRGDAEKDAEKTKDGENRRRRKPEADGRAPMIKAAVLTISDSVCAGKRADRSGPAVRERLEQLGWSVPVVEAIPDEADEIGTRLALLADSGQLAAIFTTGGTGVALRDVTPEATRAVLDREIPGLGELMRARGREATPLAVLSRALAGTRGRVLIVNLPGPPKARWSPWMLS